MAAGSFMALIEAAGLSDDAGKLNPPSSWDEEEGGGGREAWAHSGGGAEHRGGDRGGGGGGSMRAQVVALQGEVQVRKEEEVRRAIQLLGASDVCPPTLIGKELQFKTFW